jgi:hypothetical protein
MLYLPLASVSVVTALPVGFRKGVTKTATPDTGAPSSSVATPDS